MSYSEQSKIGPQVMNNKCILHCYVMITSDLGNERLIVSLLCPFLVSHFEANFNSGNICMWLELSHV